MNVRFPLFVPILALVLAVPASVVLFRRFRRDGLPRSYALCATVLIAAIASMLPNSGQRLYDLGGSLFTNTVTNASYFLFFFTLTGAWVLIGCNWNRWLLLVLVPIALFEPLKWTLALFIWSVRGFAP
jgi:hypothetical protein